MGIPVHLLQFLDQDPEIDAVHGANFGQGQVLGEPKIDAVMVEQFLKTRFPEGYVLKGLMKIRE
jgi:hypothetical protein